MQKFLTIISIALLLAGCSPKVISERVVAHDTLTIERVVTQLQHDTLTIHRTDTARIEVTRYDTLQRVTERVIIHRGQAEVTEQGTHQARTDTVYLEQGHSEQGVYNEYTPASPPLWLYPALAVGVAVGFGIAWLFRTKE